MNGAPDHDQHRVRVKLLGVFEVDATGTVGVRAVPLILILMLVCWYVLR